MVIGTRLIRKEVLMVFVMVVGVFLRLFDNSGSRIGVKSVARVSSMNVLRTNDWSITFTWICTKIGGS